jgi:hypothetical protein
VELGFGFHRFRLHNRHNRHNKVVNRTSEMDIWAICHRNECDRDKRNMLFFIELLDKFRIVRFHQLKVLVKYGDHLI